MNRVRWRRLRLLLVVLVTCGVAAVTQAPSATAASNVGAYRFYDGAKGSDGISCQWSRGQLAQLSIKPPAAGLNPKYRNRSTYAKYQYASLTVLVYGYANGRWSYIAKSGPRNAKLTSTRAVALARLDYRPSAAQVRNYQLFKIKEQITWYRPRDNRPDGSVVREIKHYRDGSRVFGACESAPQPVVNLSEEHDATSATLQWQTPRNPNVGTVTVRYSLDDFPGTPAQGYPFSTDDRTHLSFTTDPNTAVFLSVWLRSPAGRYSARRTVYVYTDAADPSTVTNLSDAVSLAAGGDHTCAVTSTAALRCWGDNASGQLGDRTTDARDAPVTSAQGVVAVAAGYEFTCALSRSATVSCWGWNGDGQIGNGSSADDVIDPADTGLTGVSALAANWFHTCAIASSRVVCWGSNSDGELGDGSTVSRNTPTVVIGGFDSTPTQLAIGRSHTCAVTQLNSLYCWGSNADGQLGTGGGNSLVPMRVPGLAVAKVVAGRRNTCALLTSGQVDCWGFNDEDGELGDGTTEIRSTPAPVSGITTATSLSMSDYHACAVLADRTVKCWGWNGYGQLGYSQHDQTLVPVSPTIPPASAVAVGSLHSCAVVDGGSVTCWGDGGDYQRGDG